MKWKICGLRRKEDIEAADKLGADYLGFIFYPKSPRFISFEDWKALDLSGDQLAKAVFVSVEPSGEDIRQALEVGFRHFQIHLPEGTEGETYLKELRKYPGMEEVELWLAPKIHSAKEFRPEWLPFIDGVLIDGKKKGFFGGTGKRADWRLFSELKEKYPEKQWILAGGLGPGDVVEAISRSGARILDFNSAIETAPGEKDVVSLEMLAREIQSYSSS
ncbi:MAG: phosphoribosylanthranilate isomerase [Opitutales bacterium]|nr:phosphoribosylanthranilate isomerase [Opitutales bacterium]